MNNPVREIVQNRFEARVFERFGGRTEGQKVFEIGCGRGVGTQIILEKFGASRVDAFDLDPDMIKIAKKRLVSYAPHKVRLSVGDAENIDAADGSYDAVFDFGIIHHIPAWQMSVKEVARVLKPGGTFYFEEVTQKGLDRWLYRTFLEHPAENRFTGGQLLAELHKNSIEVGNNFMYWLFDDLIIGVGRKTF